MMFSKDEILAYQKCRADIVVHYIVIGLKIVKIDYEEGNNDDIIGSCK
jgi:hypothetical protein